VRLRLAVKRIALRIGIEMSITIDHRITRETESSQIIDDVGFAPEVTVVMPCLNEAETLAPCIQEAMGAFRDSGIAGEVVIADNGSTDGS